MELEQLFKQEYEILTTLIQLTLCEQEILKTGQIDDLLHITQQKESICQQLMMIDTKKSEQMGFKTIQELQNQLNLSEQWWETYTETLYELKRLTQKSKIYAEVGMEQTSLMKDFLLSSQKQVHTYGPKGQYDHRGQTRHRQWRS